MLTYNLITFKSPQGAMKSEKNLNEANITNKIVNKCLYISYTPT